MMIIIFIVKLIPRIYETFNKIKSFSSCNEKIEYEYL